MRMRTALGLCRINIVFITSMNNKCLSLRKKVKYLYEQMIKEELGGPETWFDGFSVEVAYKACLLHAGDYDSIFFLVPF